MIIRMHFRVAALTSVLFASAIGACEKDKTPIQPAETRSAREQPSSATMPSTGGGMMDQLRAGCPMVVQGADVTVTDTEGGVALDFTTDSGLVADLRKGVQHMAPMYETHHGQADMMWRHIGGEGMAHGGPATGGEGMDMGMGMRMPMGMAPAGEDMGHMPGRGPMPLAKTTMTDTDLGARLELMPTDPSQLDALREHVRSHQQKMHSGECWMLQERPAQAPRREEE